MLKSFKAGFHLVCPEALLRAAGICFSAEEFDELLSGPLQLDIDDWEANTHYQGCSKRNQIIKWFWEVVRLLSLQQQRNLLRFATGHASAPIGGFGSISSGGDSAPFTIKLTSIPVSQEVRSFFPRSATCVNLLQLPRYRSKAALEKHLLLALQEEMMAFEEPA